MAAPVRYTSQKQQEKRSLRQISERLDEFGWLPTRPDEDLGEDLQVHIYFEGKATGVLFHLQAKSVTNLYERRKDVSLLYPFKVKDLLHWEQFELPVVLMVWDVNLREGRWVLWNTAVLQLDRQKPNWREQKTATVYLPWQNRTDDEGLVELRKGIGRFLFPLLTSNNPIQKITFAVEFPKTEKGKVELAAFKQLIEHGGEGSFKGEIEWPESLRPWFSELQKVIMTFGPLPSSTTLTTIIDAIDPNGETATITTELKKVKSGLETFEISNYHLPSSLIYLCFTIPQKSAKEFGSFLTTNKEAKILGRDANEACNNLKFWRIVATGANLRLSFPSHDKISLSASILPQSDDKVPPLELLQLVDKLRFIQNKTANFFEVPALGKWLPKDLQSINELYNVFKEGKNIFEKTEFTFEITHAQGVIELLQAFLKLHRQNKRIEGLRATYETSSFEIFGSIISTDRLVRYTSGKIAMPVKEFEEKLASFGSGQMLRVKFIDAHIVEIYPDWFIREAERLTKLLIEKFDVAEVYLFGSLAWGEQWNSQTDIDLAVRGLAPEKYFKAIGYLEGETKFPFDLVDLEIAPESLRERILQKGKLLVERERSAEIN